MDGNSRKKTPMLVSDSGDALVLTVVYLIT